MNSMIVASLPSSEIPVIDHVDMKEPSKPSFIPANQNCPIGLVPIPSGPQKNIPKKPMRPLTAYHIFFQIEREYIIQTLPNATEEDKNKSSTTSSTKNFLENVPQRYKAIKLSPDWYFGPGKRPKRKHRKAHGKIGFMELSRIIASRWAELETLDPEVKAFVTEIAKEELDEYLADMKEYKELTKGLGAAASAKPVVSANSSAAPSPVASPQPVARSCSRGRNGSKKRSLPLNQPNMRRLPETPVSMMQGTFQPYPAMDLSNEIEYFISRIDSDARNLLPARHSNPNAYTAVNNASHQPRQERRSSLLAFLEPLFDNLEQDSVIQEQQEQFTQHPHREQEQEQPSKKQRRNSPASVVVDICDNEIIRMWKENNAI